MTWLVTGGAGYIGAHVVSSLRTAEVPIVVLDDLSTGLPSRLDQEVPLIVGSVLDHDLVHRSLLEHNIQGVIHLAGKKQVGESLSLPLHYYRENVGGCQTLLQAMVEAGVQKLLFSSSAAVYGSPITGTVNEDSPTQPINPYGRTKLICEGMIRDAGIAHDINWIALRYFNVAGAAAAHLADSGATNLIPLLLDAAEVGHQPRIFGNDYPTPDGTCVRDFIHVSDLAQAHVAATLGLQSGIRSQRAYNVGRGQGASVREIVELARQITGTTATPLITDRRRGDPPMVVADPSAIASDLGWRSRLDLPDMVESAWLARQGTANRHVLNSPISAGPLVIT